MFLSVETLSADLWLVCLVFCCLLAVTYILVGSGEIRSRGLVQSHDHSHHVFAVEDGRCQNVPGGVLCEFIHERAEVLALQRQEAYFFFSKVHFQTDLGWSL